MKAFTEEYEELLAKVWELIRCLKKARGCSIDIPPIPSPYGVDSGVPTTWIGIFLTVCFEDCCGGKEHAPYPLPSWCTDCECMKFLETGNEFDQNVLDEWLGRLEAWWAYVQTQVEEGGSASCEECLPIAFDILRIVMRMNRWAYRGGRP